MNYIFQIVPDPFPGCRVGNVHHRHPRGHDPRRQREEVRRQLQEREGQNIHRGEWGDVKIRKGYVYQT